VQWAKLTTQHVQRFHDMSYRREMNVVYENSSVSVVPASLKRAGAFADDVTQSDKRRRRHHHATHRAVLSRGQHRFQVTLTCMSVFVIIYIYLLYCIYLLVIILQVSFLQHSLTYLVHAFS